MSKEKNYPKYASIDVCPECNSDKYIKIKEPTGFFEFSKYHYECQKCHTKFKYAGSLEVIPIKVVEEIVNKGLSGEYNRQKIKEKFREFNVYGINIYDKFKKEENKK